MKILTLVYSMGPGGTERSAVNYAVAYKRAGCDSKVWVLGEGSDRKSTLDTNDVLVYFDINTGHEQNSEELTNWKPDIIHINSFDNRFYNVLVPFKKIGSKIVETNVFSRPRYEQQFKIVDISFQLALWGFWKYQKWMNNKKGFPINLRLPFFVDSNNFSETSSNERTALRERLQIPNDAFIAARVGQSHPSKWDKRIFEVVSKTTKINDQIFFVFVGLPKQLKDEYEKLPALVKSKIRLMDILIGDAALTKFYKAIDVFVHISHIGESFGYVLTEAIVCGCPVVTLSTPLKDNAQYEVVGHQIGGYCATTTQEFIHYILSIYNDSPFVKKQLFDHIEDRFSEQALIPPLLQIFEKLSKNDIESLQTLSRETYATSKTIVASQMKLYKINGIFIKLAMEIIHTPAFYKLLALLKGK